MPLLHGAARPRQQRRGAASAGLPPRQQAAGPPACLLSGPWEPPAQPPAGPPRPQSKTGKFDPSDFWGGVFDPNHGDTFFSFASNPTRVLCDLEAPQTPEKGAARVPANYDTPTKQGGPEVQGKPAALPPAARAVLPGSLPGVNKTGTIRVAAPPSRALQPAKPGNQTARPPLPNLAAISSNRSGNVTVTLAAGNTTGKAANTSIAGAAWNGTGLVTGSNQSGASPPPAATTTGNIISTVATRNAAAALHAAGATLVALAALFSLLVAGWR